jgi:ribosomal subunit interface protein
MVDIQIAGLHTEISAQVKQHISYKLGGLDRFHPGLNKLHVTIHQAEHHGFRVDVDLHLPHGKHVVAHEHEKTIVAAVDMVTDKCANQLRRLHGKLVDSHRHAVT